MSKDSVKLEKTAHEKAVEEAERLDDAVNPEADPRVCEHGTLRGYYCRQCGGPA